MTVYSRTLSNSAVGSRRPNPHMISRLRGQIRLVKQTARGIQGDGGWVPDVVWDALKVSEAAVQKGSAAGYNVAVSALSKSIPALTQSYVAVDRRVQALETQVTALKRELERYALGMAEPVVDMASTFGWVLALGGGALALLGVGALFPAMGLSAVALGGLGAAVSWGATHFTLGSAAGALLLAIGGGGLALGAWIHQRSEDWRDESLDAI